VLPSPCLSAVRWEYSRSALLVIGFCEGHQPWRDLTQFVRLKSSYSSWAGRDVLRSGAASRCLRHIWSSDSLSASSASFLHRPRKKRDCRLMNVSTGSRRPFSCLKTSTFSKSFSRYELSNPDAVPGGDTLLDATYGYHSEYLPPLYLPSCAIIAHAWPSLSPFRVLRPTQNDTVLF